MPANGGKGARATTAGWAAAAAGLAAWRAARREVRGREAAARDADGRRRAAEGERERLARRLRDRERQLARLQRLRAVEREWNRELRAQVAELHRHGGALGAPSDVRGLILRLALTLTEAEKGLLLTRAGGGGSELRVAAAEGFAHDPARSALARRFARQVIEADRILREDAPSGRRAAADEEIANLVAIPIYVRDEFSGVVVCANRAGGFEELDDQVLLALGDHAGAALDSDRLRAEVRATHVAVIRMLAAAIEAKDASLRPDPEPVLACAAAVAERHGLDPEARERLVFATLLRDVGKIGISERVLLKPGRLSLEERTAIEQHPRIGARLVEPVPALRPIVPAILHHHERWDGTGYPDRLAGAEIPLEARIVAVADAVSAMLAERPYRPRMSLAAACAELEREAGAAFDPDVAAAWVQELERRPPAPAAREPAVERALAPAAADTADGLVVGPASLAMLDSLTLLYSHRHGHEALAAAAARAAVAERPFSVVVVELTGLAELNRRRGYDAGDAALTAAAGALRAAAARAGATAFRDSGSRLALVLPDTDEPSTRALAAVLGRGLDAAGEPRVGIATWRSGQDGEQVLALARAALAAR